MILDELAAHAKERVERAKEKISLEKIEKEAYLAAKAGEDKAFRFERALKSPGLSLICEVKKASPSKGIISEDFPYLDIAKAYEEAGADCVSCLTEPKWFLGSDEIFRQIRAHIKTPMLRKDFTVDAYQLYEAKAMGADCALIICALHNREKVRDFIKICDDLGMSALVETHDEREIDDALWAGARIVGVNNRNLKNFNVDINTALRLREKIPKELIFVAESGISGVDDFKAISKIGADAALIGEALMRSGDIRKTLGEFRKAGRGPR